MTDREDRDRDDGPPGLASRRHGREDRDDDADDPQLQSLRAVWLGMADEDPPDRGLADLMAAARVKAEEMARPTLWQRIAALLRRPAVLALASIMVLLGGVVLLGERRASVGVEPEAVTATQRHAQDQTVAPTAATGAAPTDSTGAAAAGDELTAMPGAGEFAPAAEVPALIEEEPAEKVSNQVARGTAERSPRPRARDSKDSARDDDGRVRDEGQVGRGFASPPAEPASDAVAAQTTGAAGARTSDAAAANTSATATAKAEDMSVAESDVRLGAAAQPTRAPQYVAQAKSAAARGDCAAARVLMKRVAKDNATLYRKTIANDAALKKCIAR